ncbi:MAG: peptidyl-tRNA hydrolase [Candidatus Parcubacteria bacterium]|nr:MAG: peptidyl-tRNA hydrolase [Candidatus Parcubacteria bacterium]
MNSTNKIKLIYGIGNDDERYSYSFHNIGKEIVKYFFEKPSSLKYAQYQKYNKHLILATNTNYMNECGKGLRELSKEFKITPSSILIIHDDADLSFPLFKISFNKNSAGHKGIESIINHLKTKKFWRFRIGIQKKQRQQAIDIVLNKMNNREKELMNKKIKPKFKIILDKLASGYLPNELNIAKNFFLS